MKKNVDSVLRRLYCVPKFFWEDDNKTNMMMLYSSS